MAAFSHLPLQISRVGFEGLTIVVCQRHFNHIFCWDLEWLHCSKLGLLDEYL